MPYLSSMECFRRHNSQKFLSEKQMLDIIISVRPLSSFTQTSSDSKKYLIFTWLRIPFWQYCVYALPWSELNKGCKHTNNSTRTWIVWTLVKQQSSYTKDTSHMITISLTIGVVLMMWYNLSTIGPRVSLALDHPVTVESPNGQFFSKSCLHCCTLYVCGHE